VHNVSDVRQIELHKVEPFVPGPSRLEVEIAIAKLKNDKLPDIDQVLAEVIQGEDEILLSVIHKLINCVWNNEECLIVPFHKNGGKTDLNNYCGTSLLSISYNILSNILLSRLGPYID
jgi:hypothetical protein